MNIIDSFSGDYRFLSNFWILSTPIEFEGLAYPTTEHFFAAMKTADLKAREEISQAETPGRAKRLGRKVSLRGDWDEVRVEVMQWALKEKFSEPRLRNQLAATGNSILIEGNHWHDQFWGNCTCEEHINDDGANVLGILLMNLRLNHRMT